MRATLAIFAASSVLACSRRSMPPQPAALADPITDASPPEVPDAQDAQPEPLAGPWQLDLIDGTTKLGVVSVPVGTREPRPIMVVLHGGSDRPEWECGAWRGITSAYAFLVCPRGVGTNDASLSWSSPTDTKLRVARAIAATRKLFGAWVREAPIVLAGFSMGGTQAALLARSEPATYRRVALAESAYAPDAAMAFAEAASGERAVFLCTTLGCEAPYRNAARLAAKHGVPARLNIAGTNQHGMWDVVVSSMRRDWPWLVEGAAGWESYRAPAEDAPLPGKTEVFEAR